MAHIQRSNAKNANESEMQMKDPGVHILDILCSTKPQHVTMRCERFSKGGKGVGLIVRWGKPVK